METENRPDELISSALLAEVEAAAAAEHRSTSEMVREALELYLRERQVSLAKTVEPRVRDRLTPGEAGARILDSRPRHRLPEGMTIRDMIEHGRA